MKRSSIQPNTLLMRLTKISFLLLLAYASSVRAESQLQGFVMHVQLTPAVCALDAASRKQRKCLEGYSLTVASLLPEILTEQDCTTPTSALLSPLQGRVVARIMPDEASRAQLWHAVGGCVGMNASQYFRTIINFSERLKIPADLTGSSNKVVQQNAIKQQILHMNPGLPANGLRLSCQKISRNQAVLTEMKLCYRINGQYKSCSEQVVNNCPAEFVIRGAY